jgi:kynurenine formamidase
MRILAAALVLSLGACAMPGGLPLISPNPEPAFPEGWAVLDLTRPLDHNTPFLPFAEAFPFELLDFKSPREIGWRTGGFSGLEHMGTHVAAPLARLQIGAAVDTIPARQLVAPLVVLDVPTGALPGGTASMADVVADEKARGPIPAGSIVVLRTGRGALAGSDPALLGRRADGSVAFPGWAADAVRYLAVERRVRAVGTDAMAIDSGANAVQAPAQTAGSAAGIWFLAGLADLSRVPSRGAVISVGPMPIVGAAGAPARVLAFVPPKAQ